jgi:hypothetical protein
VVLALAICALGASVAPASAAAPTVVKTDDATEVTYTTAKVSGEVERPADPDPAFDTDCTFEYIPAADFGPRSEVKRLTVTGDRGTFELYLPNSGQLTPHLPFDSPAATVQSALEGLGDIGPGNVTVTGGPGSPSGSSPYLITFSGALANKNVETLEVYTIDPTGISAELVTITEGHAEGWEDAGQAGCEPETPLKTPGKTAVTANLTGLTNGTEYRLRLTASNLDGSDSEEAADTFTTKAVSVPTVSIDPVTTFTDTTAQFVGHVTPGGTDPAFEANWNFQCTPACPDLTGGSISADESSHKVEADASALEPNINYEVKLVATNAGGSESAQTSFQTTAVGPVARTLPAFALGNATEALVGGKVNPKNSQTEYWVEYGPGSGATYPSNIPVAKNASAGSGGQAVFVTQKIPGLSPATEYHYRLVAKSTSGESQGEDVSFETPPSAEPIQANCPNAKIRTETNSATLPECRAYEMTSEQDKNGADISFGMATSPDGNRVGYAVYGAFGDTLANNAIASYVAQRGPSGWTTRSLMPRVESPSLGFNRAYYPVDNSTDLSSAVLALDQVTSEEPVVNNVLLLKPGSSPTWVTAPTVPGAEIFPKAYVGRSDDASHIFFESKQEFVPGAGNGESQIWEWFDGKVRLVSAQGDGSPFPGGASVGAGFNGQIQEGTNYFGELPQPLVVSADGSRVFFAEGRGVFGARGVYVREDGLHTHPISVSRRTGSVGDFDSSAHFVGAAADGSRAYLRSESQLTNDATPGGGLYSYNLETDTMHFVGAGALSVGAVLVSEDGERVYFTSPKLLAPGKGIEGAKNLYTANDEGGELAFIGTVEPGDLNFADSANKYSEDSYVNATSDGAEFAFDSTARLTAYDNTGHREIYLYDAARSSLRCVSCRPDGHPAEGDASLRNTGEGLVATGRPRALTSDGSALFFRTSDGLVPGDANGLRDVYEYRNGQISLISTGTSAFPTTIIGSSPDGKNVFFMTRDPLVGQDIDGSRDIYDARVEGGFPAPPPPVSLCEGEACQGQAHSAPAYASPGTASLAGRGNTNGRAKERKHKACGRKFKKQHSKCGGKTKKHKAKKHQTKKTSKSRRGE